MANTHGRVAAFNPHFERLLNIIRYGTEKDAISLFSNEQYNVNLEIEYVFEDRMMYKITPLNWAVRFNKTALCKFLLDHGARPYCNLVYEYYPLHEACCRGFDKIVTIFIELKCDLNKTTPTDKDTPLHIACVRGNVGCVNLLLSANANPNLRNAVGHTPLEAAVYNSQDDLVKLFAAYGISTSCYLSGPVTTTGSAPVGPHPTGHTALRCHAPIQRRHSLSSPTNTHNAVQRLLSSVRPHSRPNSVLISDSEPTTDSSRPPSRVAMVTQNCMVSPPTAIISLPQCKDSLLNNVRTTAPCTTPLTVTQGENGLTRPTYITQLSIASASSANSPSPVERDCGLQKNWSNDSRNQNPQSHYYSMPTTFTTPDLMIGSPGTVPSAQHSSQAYTSMACGQQSRLADISHACKTFPGVESTTVKITPAVQLPNHRRPHRKLKGLHQATSLDSCSEINFTSSYGPSSASDFPLTATSQVSQDRTKDSEICKKTLPLPQNSAPVETLTPSPSRERINSLAHCITNPLKSFLSGNGDEPCSSVAQKLTEVVAQMVNITPQELNSILNLAVSEPPCTKSYCPPDLTSEIPRLTTGTADHPAEALLEIGLCIEDHPREIRMCDPLPGYMSVVFKMRPSQSRVHDKETDVLAKQRNEIVKVIVQVFNLRNPVDSNLYHSLTSDQFLYSEPRNCFLNEVAILQQLSNTPHPNVACLVSHFKADVSNQYDRFARQARPDNHEELYVTRKEADFIVLSMPSLSLLRYFEDQQKSSLFCSGLSEKKVLSILAQVLLAAAHLNQNGISHNAIHPENIFVNTNDRDTLIVSNFACAISLHCASIEEISSLRQMLRTDKAGNTTFCTVAPEVKEALQSIDLESSSSSIESDLPSLFQTSDSYAAAQMIYELVLGPSHKFIRELGISCYSYDHIPLLTGFSSLTNHLLKTLFAYEATCRMAALDGAVSSLVLLFGPHPSQVTSVQDCKEWLLAETVEFYLRPFLKDSLNSDYVDSLAKLLCMYLALGNANPGLVWKSCKFFKDYTS